MRVKKKAGGKEQREGTGKSFFFDSNILQVQSVRGLRVIDASIIPAVPSGNTHAPTLGVASIGADKILSDYVI